MNKRDRQQLRACIARDLIEGQGEQSPTRELLKQYAPLEGIITTPASDIPRLLARAAPVENSMAPHATVARNDPPPWHGATVAQHATVASPATVERYAEVKGELRVPNTINFSLFPTLDPFAKAVYYQLFLLSHGFRKDTCIVGLAKLAKSVLISQRKLQNTIVYLEKRELIKRIGSELGGRSKGNLYRVLLPVSDSALDVNVAQGANVVADATVAPHATIAQGATMASDATNKYDDDDKKRKSSSNGENLEVGIASVENHSCAAVPRERQEDAARDFSLVRELYEKATGNRWNKSDSEAYYKNGIDRIPIGRTLVALEAVSGRTPAKINSFKYFIKEILATPDPRNRIWRKKQLEKIVQRIRDNSVGLAGFSYSDFVEEIKCACAREGVPFDNDIFNELAG